MRLTLAVAVACLAFGGLAAAGDATAAIRKQVDIPAEGLAPALNALAKDRNFQIVYVTEEVANVRTEGAVGEFTTEEALKKLLTGTGLTYRYLDDKTVTVGSGKISRERGGSASKITSPGSPGDANTNQEGKKSSSGTFRVAQVDQGKSASAASVGKQTSTSQENAKSPSAGLEEIVVTAQKRTEKLQDVAGAVAVLSGLKLEDEGVLSLQDYAKQIPSLNIIGANGAGRGQPVLRGITSGSDRSTSVALYLDDVPFSISNPSLFGFATRVSLDPDLADIDHIEVLVGPQSTLYGASAEGGVIKFITNQPDLHQSEGSLRIQGQQIDGAGTGYGLRGSMNIPLIDGEAALRISGFYRNDPGFVDNQFDGKRDVNTSRIIGGRGALRFSFNDDFETTLSGLVQNIDTEGNNNVFLDTNTLKPALGSIANSTPFKEPENIEFRQVSDTASLDLHFAKLTNIASYTDIRDDLTYDFSYLNFLAGNGTVVYKTVGDAKRVSDELRLASSPGRFEWLLGGYYVHESGSQPLSILGGDSQGRILAPSSPFYNVYSYTSPTKYTEHSAFGDATYHLTQHFEATLGVRYTEDDQSTAASTTGILNFGPPVIDYYSVGRDSAVNYLATVSYKPSSDMTLYVRAASAFRPGGTTLVNKILTDAGVPQSYKSDQLWNYEAGIKGSSWDDRIRFAADVFHMKWTDIQVNISVGAFGAVGNSGGAQSNGGEVSVQLLPLNGLTLALSGAFVDAKYTVAEPDLGIADGDRLPYSPKFNVTALVDYRYQSLRKITPTVGLTFAHHGSQETAPINGPPINGPVYSLPSFNTLDFRAGLEWSRYSVVARINNVTNEYGLTQAVAGYYVGAPLIGSVIQPRTYGLSIQANF